MHKRWQLAALREAHHARFLLRPSALELFMADRSTALLNFPTAKVGAFLAASESMASLTLANCPLLRLKAAAPTRFPWTTSHMRLAALPCGTSPYAVQVNVTAASDSPSLAGHEGGGRRHPLLRQGGGHIRQAAQAGRGGPPAGGLVPLGAVHLRLPHAGEPTASYWYVAR